MEDGSVIIEVVKKYAIKVLNAIKLLVKMLCWKKGSYSPTDKQKSITKENKKELVTLQRNNRLKSFKKNLQKIKRIV